MKKLSLIKKGLLELLKHYPTLVVIML